MIDTMPIVSNYAAPTPRLAEINGLRGLAILSVIWHHLSFALMPEPPRVFGLSTEPALWNGWAGVNLFFILSGFVLYLPYAQHKRGFAAHGDVLAFYKHRFFRLIPLYYLVVVATSVLGGKLVNADAHTIREFVACLTFTFPFARDTFSPSSNWALWSIGTEVLFSLIFPFIVMLAGRVGLTKVLGFSVFFSLCVRLVGRSLYPHFYGPDWIIDALLIGRLDEFVIGMWLAHAHVSNRLPGRRRLSLALSVVLIAVAFHGFSACFDKRIPVEWTAILNNVLDAGLGLLIVAALDGDSLLARLLRYRPLQVLGMGCYSLYLWHLPVLRAFQIDQGKVDLMHVAGFLGATLFLAALTYRFVEFRNVASWKSLFLDARIREPSRSAVRGAGG
ncbi:acyltransferase family protein [Burkholderia stagnalis]|uniref:acyltransferase family protein n=1 Tax=Burkholderia stagnalis TaxID=1503054 RepID=UPI0012DAD71B|nr:acyltransferase [Burkholderia stagnalis]